MQNITAELECLNSTDDLGIFVFGSFNHKIPSNKQRPFEFSRTFEEHFPNTNAHFYTDYHQCWWAKGLLYRSEDVDGTIQYIESKIKDYSKVIFMGHSAGGYTSILFGSILNVDRVIAFYPQTDLEILCDHHKRIANPVEDRYMDILPYINDTTEYHLYSSEHPDDITHDRIHCTRIGDLGKSNVYTYVDPNRVVEWWGKPAVANNLAKHLTFSA